MKSVGFAKNLRQILVERSLTLKSINEATGIPMSTLSEWTAGREPKVSEALVRLSRFLEVSLDELIMVEGAVHSNGNGVEVAATFQDGTAIVLLDGKKYRIRLDRVG